MLEIKNNLKYVKLKNKYFEIIKIYEIKNNIKQLKIYVKQNQIFIKNRRSCILKPRIKHPGI